MSRGVKERGHPIIGAKESGMECAATEGGNVFQLLEGQGAGTKPAPTGVYGVDGDGSC